METVEKRQRTIDPRHQDQRQAGTTPVTGPGTRMGQRRSARPSQGVSDATVELNRGLGWFSVGLGLTQLLAPRALGHAIGAGYESPGLMRLLGARELTAGIGILSESRKSRWLWARVLGDAMDLALLASAMSGAGVTQKARLAFATTAVLGVTALDIQAARATDEGLANQPGTRRRDGSIRVEKSLAISRTPDECYAMWRDFASLPRFMRHLDAVEITGPTQSHWSAKAPGGATVEWDAEITRDEPGRVIAWRSLPGADVDNSGAVEFRADPADRGTVVHVHLQYKPPGGALGAAVAKLFGEEPEMQIREDLRRFKQLIETGEIPTIDGQSHGSRSPGYRMARGDRS